MDASKIDYKDLEATVLKQIFPNPPTDDGEGHLMEALAQLSIRAAYLTYQEMNRRAD